MKKLTLLAFSCLVFLTGSAQNAPTTPKDLTYGVDVKFGTIASCGSFGIGFHMERSYNPYITWNLVSVSWEAPFDSPADLDRISLRTGLRGFSPCFFRNMRGYANVDMGYTATVAKCMDEDYYMVHEDFHGFGLEVGAGLRLTDHIGLGYAFDWDSETKYKGHYFHFCYLF